VPSEADVQLGVIAEAVAGLEQRQLSCWLAGGWAVDFLIGRVTREHRDVDIVIWASDASVATDALRGAGFKLQQARAPELIHFERDGVPVTLSFIEREADGTLVTPG
jgi:Aminoglycoside-2''-adenylyltransferase